MTGGELECDRDHDIDEPFELGYQPVYAHSNGKPGFVLVYSYDRDQIDKLKLHSLVNIERSKKRGDTVAVGAASLTKSYTSSREDLMRPADLTESLLRIWKMPELVGWYRLTHGKVDPNIGELKKRVPKLKPLKSDGKPFDTMHEKAAEKYATDQAGDSSDVFDAVVNKAKNREEEHRRNGHLNGKPK